MNILKELTKQLEQAETVEEIMKINSLVPKHSYDSPQYIEFCSLKGKIGIKKRNLTLTDEEKQSNYKKLHEGRRKSKKSL